MTADPPEFDHIIDRAHSRSSKWRKYAGRDVIPLWLADMDFRAPDCVLAALREHIDHGVLGYDGPPPRLARVIVERLAARYGWEVRPAWLVWLPGLVCGINVACRSLGKAGGKVVTTVPVYPPFLQAPGNCGHELRTVPLHCGPGRWEFAFEAVEQAARGADMLLLCSPHNPTGRVWSEEELRRVAEICQRHGLLICSDEIHCDLVLEEKRRHIPIAALAPEVAARTITLMAPSKTYNIPGLYASFAVIPDPRLRKACKRATRGIVPQVNTLGFTAALAAYGEGQAAAWLERVLAYLRGNHALVRQAVGAMPGLAITPVEGTYLAWIDARDLDVESPAAFFEKAGVGLSDGKDFGLPGFIRLNFACPRPLLREALARMQRAVAGRR